MRIYVVSYVYFDDPDDVTVKCFSTQQKAVEYIKNATKHINNEENNDVDQDDKIDEEKENTIFDSRFESDNFVYEIHECIIDFKAIHPSNISSRC